MGNKIYVQGSYVDVHDNENVYLSVDKVGELCAGDSEVLEAQSEKEGAIENKDLEQAVAKVKQYMWAASAYAVLYCVCRDYFGYSGSISQFEREIECMDDRNKAYDCRKGTIINANRNNSYYKYNAESWEKRGAKEKVLILRDRFKEAMESIIQENRHRVVA